MIPSARPFLQMQGCGGRHVGMDFYRLGGSIGEEESLGGRVDDGQTRCDASGPGALGEEGVRSACGGRSIVNGAAWQSAAGAAAGYRMRVRIQIRFLDHSASSVRAETLAE